MCVVFNMSGLLCLHFIAILTVSIKSDFVYFENDTLTDMLYNVEMSNGQSCATLQGVIIVMVGTTNSRPGGGKCEEEQSIPIDQIAVKHLISQANDVNNSSQLIYLANFNGELTDGNISVWNNLTLRQWACILSKHSVAVLKPDGVNIEKFIRFRSISLQTVLMAEYMRYDSDYTQLRRQATYSITPNVRALSRVVSYFIKKTGWTRVGLLHDGTDNKLIERFASEGKKLAFQIYPIKYDGINANDIYNYFKSNNIRVVVFAGLVQTYLQALDDLYDYYYTGQGTGWIYMSTKNSFPLGYNLSELIKCLQRDAYRVYYGLQGTISIVLSEGYGKKHEQFRSLMKTLIAQEGYSIENYQSFPLLTATYAAETASVLIKALNYFITEQKWNYSLIKSGMQNIERLIIKQTGLTGSVAIDSKEKEVYSTFVVYNVNPSSEDKNTLQTQTRAYIFYAKSGVNIQYVDRRGINSTEPTIVYADGTTIPPPIATELFLIPFISLRYKSLMMILSQVVIIISISLYTLLVHYGEKNYEYFNAKWMYRRGDINFCNVPRNIRKLLQKNRFPNSFQISQLPLQAGLLKDTMVYIRKVNFDSKNASQRTRKQINFLIELHHPNVNPFIGCIVEPNFTAVMTNYCSRRSLKTILTNSEFILDYLFKLSFISDAAMGLHYLHNKRIIHERLHLNNCLVDEYWTLKLSDYSIEVFNNKEIEMDGSTSTLSYYTNSSTTTTTTTTTDDNNEDEDMDYLAPEVKDGRHKPTKSSDIYSLGYVSNAIVTAQSTAKNATQLSNRNATIIKELNKLVAQCMKLHYINRPSIESVTATLTKLNNGDNLNSSTTGRDNLLEAYAKNLEECLAEKTEHLENLEAALTGEIPKPLVKKINEGKRVPVQKYERAAILVVIIGEVENIANPKKLHKTSAIVAALQKILASVISKYSVLKVEQTGSKCVFASGVYEMSVNDPIAEIGDAAIHMNSMCGRGSLTDDSDVEPNLKMAIHSGTVICGVTQEDYPKHVIYGTTLDFATSVAINAPSNNIYVSYQVAKHLQRIGRFNVKYARELECEKSIEILYQLEENCAINELKLFTVMPRRGSRCSRRGSVASELQHLCIFEEECHESDDPFNTMPI